MAYTERPVFNYGKSRKKRKQKSDPLFKKIDRLRNGALDRSLDRKFSKK